MLRFVESVLGVFRKSGSFLVDLGTSHKEHSCARKVRYGHAESAEKAAKVMTKKVDRPMEAYPCAYCGGWHVGGVMW